MPTDLQIVKRGSKPADKLRAAESNLGLSVPPSTDIGSIFKEAKLEQDDVFLALRNSMTEEAKLMIAKLETLSKGERKLITIDHLIAAAGVDPSRALSLVIEEVHRQKSAVSSLLMASAHPEVTKSTIIWAHTAEGVQDRKLLHSSMGTTPVPKNTTSIVNVRDMKVQSNTQINVGVKSMSDVVKEMDDIFSEP